MGAASVLAMAPFFVWPVLFLTLPVLVWRLDGAVCAPRPDPGWRAAPATRAALAGWWFGFGYFLAGLFWIGEAFLVEAEKFAALMPFAVLMMPAGLALFWAAASAVAVSIWRPGLSRVVVLAAALAGAEWLRGHILSGFPWNVVGYALTYPLVLMQSAALLGIYGLTIIAVAVLAAPLVALVDGVRQSDRSEARRAVLIGLAGPALALAALVGYGAHRLAIPDPPATATRVRIVQPSVLQREKWRPENQRAIFDLHLALSRQAPDGTVDGARGIDLIVWPEAAMPFVPLASPQALEEIGRMLPAGAVLLSGALRVADTPSGRRNVYNSLIAFGAGGKPIAIYDKIHLVPFGEYLPMQGTLEAIGLEQLSRLRGGFSAGPAPRPLMRLGGLPVLAPLVCYEAIFPGALVQGAVRPAMLVNVTNDGWFGNSTGPRQHFHQARVRAVEEGLPLLRVANNGISAVIDAHGRVLQALGLDVKGVIDGRVPGALASPPYARFGDLPFALLLALALVVVVATGSRWSLRHG